MSARMKVVFDGNEYFSKTTNEMTAEKMRDVIYEQFGEMNKLTMEMDNGFIVFGKDVVQGSIIIFENIA